MTISINNDSFFCSSLETEPFDWFPYEKPANTATPFENYQFSNPTRLKYENANRSTLFQVDDFNKPKQYASPSANIARSMHLPPPPPLPPAVLVADNNQPKIASAPFQPQPAYSTSCPTVEIRHLCLKNDTLTPPESPKDEDLLKLIGEIEPATFEQFVLTGQVDGFESATVSPSSPEAFFDFYDSPSSLDDVVQWSPAATRPSTCKVARKRATDLTTTRPYSRAVAIEDRKQRKKEQNKYAATRYRLRKKAEFEDIKLEERSLSEKNLKLRVHYEDLCREVRYLKSLMRDLYCKK